MKKKILENNNKMSMLKNRRKAVEMMTQKSRYACIWAFYKLLSKNGI